MGTGPLDPQTREKFLDHLRPPVGFVLDRAIGTTYSLDLLSLLIAPLATVLFECEDGEAALASPSAILEALSQTQGRITIFCQAGMIKVPKGDNLLVNLLGSSIVEVSPENAEGVFHPKVWVLRFVGSSREVKYRVLCLSRNMTFDPSWDTLLCLEGDYDGTRQNAIAANHPLGDFLKALPGLALRSAGEARKDIAKLADEVRRVHFDLPEPFTRHAFHPLGIPDYSKAFQLPQGPKLVVSPFLSESTVAGLAKESESRVLISRTESLDAISPSVLGRFEKGGKLFVMSDSAELPAEDLPLAAEIAVREEEPRGLHAKLFVVEDGWDAHVFTGSANATHSALDGINVEFMVELIGKKSKVGIAPILGDDEEEGGLRSMVVPYVIGDVKKEVDPKAKAVEDALKVARGSLSRASWQLACVEESPGVYSLELQGKVEGQWPTAVSVRCWPAMVAEGHSAVVHIDSGNARVRFESIPLACLGGFIAFRLMAKIDGASGELGFVLNIPVVGIPEGRDRAIFLSVISDVDKFLRYLLLVLAENPEDHELDGLRHPSADGRGDGHASAGGQPVLEELIRASSRNPERLERVRRIMEDLMKDEGGRAVLPKGFERIWPAIQAAIGKTQQ